MHEQKPLKCRIQQASSLSLGIVCNFLDSVSLQQKFEATDGPVLQLCVTAQFYLESKGKYILEAWGHADPKDTKRREASVPILAPLFMFFLLPPSLPYVNWASQEGWFFYLRSSLQSLDPPLFYFCGFSPSLCFSHSHFGLLFPILTTQHCSVQFNSVAQSCPTLCNPMNHSTPGLPVHHQHPEFTQTHVHRVGDAIQ